MRPAGLRKLVVLGAGPVGLMAALRAKQLGLAVEVMSDRAPDSRSPSRLEVLPAPMLGLLVEFGVHPARLGVASLNTHRLTKWGAGSEIVATEGPPTAHVGRPALELALLDLALRAGVKVETTAGALPQDFGDGVTLLDASGRSAVTACELVRPEMPLVCRTFVCHGNPEHIDCFAIADGPQGYAYRLRNSQTTTLGVVGHGQLLRGRPAQVFDAVKEFAPWLLEGIHCSQLESSGAGAASAQWSLGSAYGAKQAGDARIAHDALGSQGLALGLADALRAVGSAVEPGTAHVSPSGSQLDHHRHTVAESISRSLFANSPEWSAYGALLLGPRSAQARPSDGASQMLDQ